MRALAGWPASRTASSGSWTIPGIDAADLRQAAGSPGDGVAMLDFLLAHEELLLGFCEAQSIKPRDLHLARHVPGRSG